VIEETGEIMTEEMTGETEEMTGEIVTGEIVEEEEEDKKSCWLLVTS